MAKELTPKWIKFIAHYAGDVRESAAFAGLNYSYCRLQMIKDQRINLAIKNRNLAEANTIAEDRQGKAAVIIATRQDRQNFWTNVMQDPEENMRDRLRAAELLGKSEADFTEKIQQETQLTIVRKIYDPN